MHARPTKLCTPRHSAGTYSRSSTQARTACIIPAPHLTDITQCQTTAGTYSSFIDTGSRYLSTSYFDDLALASCWLFKATGSQAYLQECQANYAQHVAKELRSSNATVLDYRRSIWAVDLLLYSISARPEYSAR